MIVSERHSVFRVQICLWRAKQAGIAWPLSPEQDEAALAALLYPQRPPGVEVQPTPHFEWVERELKRKHVTRRQLWREYLDRHPDGLKVHGVLCEVPSVAAQPSGVNGTCAHAGDQLFVDYAGDAVPLVNPKTGLEQRAWLFVAVWPTLGVGVPVCAQDLNFGFLLGRTKR